MQRRLTKSVLWVVAHPRWVLGIALVVVLASALWAHHSLTVSSDQNELFSPKVKFFHDWLEFNRKFPENQAIYIVIEPVHPGLHPAIEQWIRINRSITARLRALPQVTSVLPQLSEEGLSTESKYAPPLLFGSSKDLLDAVNGVRQFAPLMRLWGEAPPTAERLLLGATPMSRFLSALALRPPDEKELKLERAAARGWVQAAQTPGLTAAAAAGDVPDLLTLWAQTPEQLGYFYVPDQDPRDPPHHLMLIRVYAKEDHSTLTSEADVIDAIRNAAYDAGRPYSSEFTVGVTGRPVLDADQDRTTEQDSRRAEILALSVVFIGLALFLRSVWLAVVAEISLAIAIGWTFGWATLTVRHLNLLSNVFLIALIGIGMDYLIQIMAAYRREARRYVRPQAVWARVFRYVGPPVNTACIGAAGAFLVSAFTHFRGAAELGIIAGGGLLLCLVVGYTVLPALLTLFPPKLKPYPVTARYGAAPVRTWRRLLLPAIWIIAIFAGIPDMMRSQFNSNLLDLENPDLSSVRLVRKLQTWECVVLSTDLAKLRQVRDGVQALPTVAGTDSILTAMDNRAWLVEHAGELPRINWTTPAPIMPGELPGLAAKARSLADRLAPSATATTAPAGSPASSLAAQTAAELRSFADAITDPHHNAQEIAASLSAWQDAFVNEMKRILSMFNPPPLKISSIPPAIREHLVSTVETPPGEYTYALYIEPKADLWDRENLGQFVRQVEGRVAEIPAAPPVTGIASNIYHSTASIQQAFYHATAYALALIFVLVLIDLRNLVHTLIAVSVLALGLPMLVAIMGRVGASWNFANFFALPILIGAGHEYGVFMMHRYREALQDPRRVWRRWDPADRALLLCAYVTCSSFGFFWLMSSHLGLRSLGLVMAVGTLCIYLAALMVVRSFLTWKLERDRTALESYSTSDATAADRR